MPLGWYLAQGLIPIGPSSSNEEEGPCELPDGRLVCGPHGFVTCGKCCTDYSFMKEALSGNMDDELDELDELDEVATIRSLLYHHANPETSTAFPRPSINALGSLSDNLTLNDAHLKKQRGTGRVFPKKFFPPSDSITPTELFSGRLKMGLLSRYTHRNDHQNVLIFTDGACLGNGQINPRAGWAFVQGSLPEGELLTVSGRLEKEGPFGNAGVQSSNRAELRAVIAALRFRCWSGEGFHTMVIATDSEYIADGATRWAKNWFRNGWRTNGNAAVKNRDLWEMLLGEVERLSDAGLTVHFWRIRRDWNNAADAAAKKAAAENDSFAKWKDTLGMIR